MRSQRHRSAKCSAIFSGVALNQPSGRVGWGGGGGGERGRQVRAQRRPVATHWADNEGRYAGYADQLFTEWATVEDGTAHEYS